MRPRWQGPSGWGGVCRRVRQRRLNQKPRRGWLKWLIAASLLLLPGCLVETSSTLGAAGSLGSAYLNYQSAEKGQAVIITPPLVDYSREIQSAAAHELEAMGVPCPRDFVADDCSVPARMIIDYGDLREKIRAANKDE